MMTSVIANNQSGTAQTLVGYENASDVGGAWLTDWKLISDERWSFELTVFTTEEFTLN